MTFTDTMNTELAKPLNKAHVKPPAPGKHGDYIEGWRVIDEANRIFGFDGWHRETVELALTAIFEESGKWTAGYRAKVRITVGDVIREGTGCGSGEKQRNAVEAHESAIKEAETDAMKRALMTFGNPFGLALYDKSKANIAEDKPPTLADWQHAELTILMQAAKVPVADINKAAGVTRLDDVPADKFESIKKKLTLTIEKNKAKEPA